MYYVSLIFNIHISNFTKQTEYVDEGDPIYKCTHCGAAHWYGERAHKKRNSRKLSFKDCCMHGKVKLPLLELAPQELIDLITGNDERSRNFRENIRAYNMMFSFTSLGGKIDHSINVGRGPKIYRIHGENYHLMGSMIPDNGHPKFSQLYIHDTSNEVMNRLRAYCSNRDNSTHESPNSLRADIVEMLSKMLKAVNPYVEMFNTYKERFREEDTETLHFVLLNARGKDGRLYNNPTSSEVAALVVGDFVLGMDKRDIVLERKSGKLKRISEINACYLPLQYPIVFPRGEDGFRLDIENTFQIGLVRNKRI